MMSDKDNLEQYRAKRDPGKTPEPFGGEAGGGEPIFVVQKHDASHLHYDLRLQVDDVLKSWAVPKGPSIDPKVKRLAVPTEDHPLDYAGFEGVIPKGEYGGGTVMVWDTGTYRNMKADGDEPQSMAECYEKGHLEFSLEGNKLKGAFVMVRTNRGGAKPQWLLWKKKDEFAVSGGDILVDEPNSATTGRTLDQIACEDADKEPPECAKKGMS
ncbi:MAG: DNA ligase [Candidatus Coatesbacteria bacterium]|nr:DNA ligase [Candidatus Coatesbacteria bacterium]